VSIGSEIAAAHDALAPERAALIIYRALFEQGPQRLSDSNKFIAVAAITGGLMEWKKQLLARQAGESEKWKKMYQDAKAELDEAKLRVAICKQEHGG
jgi:hypothetical protein